MINSYAGRNAGDVIIPDGITTINGRAFEKVGVTSIEIPESVTNIGGMCFSGEELESLIIHSNFEKIGTFAFSFDTIKYLEFTVNEFPNSIGIIWADEISEIKVPYSEDHSVLEYYKGLIESLAIRGEVVGSIVEKEV